jgi:glutaredoxin-like YruB-family protein
MKNVRIFTTPTCMYCKMAKEFMDDHAISYQEHDVSVDAEKRQEMIEKTGHMGVPVIMVDDEIIIGFDKDKLGSVLEVAA